MFTYGVQTLENPFLGNGGHRPRFPVSHTAVNALHRPNRNEPQHTRPLLVGRVCVCMEPTALAGGTAAPAKFLYIFSSDVDFCGFLAYNYTI